MNAYSEIYLYDAMRNLGETMDYAVNDCKLDANEFIKHFISSGVSEQFGKGNPKYVSGLSGVELVLETLSHVGLSLPIFEPKENYVCSPEYWCGWILAFYQWKSGYSFRHIFKTISPLDILRLYPTLHEASEDRAVDAINEIIQYRHTVSILQAQRENCGLSQREPAEKSDVNLRTILQYELRTKDINKASVSTIMTLAKALFCQPEDILE